MPNIDSVPQVLYEPNQPYHYYYDNLPLRNILTRIGLVNIQVDTNTDMIRGAAGDAVSIGARLGASLEGDGSIKKEAVDACRHGIGHHEDGDGPDGVAYVRMTLEERAKLGLIQSESNRLLIEIEDQFPTIGSHVTFTDGTLKLKNSQTVFFDFEAPDVVRAHSAFPPDVAHRHHYDKTPVRLNPSSSSSGHVVYKTTSLSTPYMDGSLRVYVNGVRLTGSAIPVPNSSGTSFSPLFIKSQSPGSGTFVLSRTLAELDSIRIDFDQSFFSSSPSSYDDSSSSSAESSSEEGSSSSSSVEVIPEEGSSSSSSVEVIPEESSSSSSQPCDFIECGGSMAYADCGMASLPGYTSYMDCGLCECVDVLISSSSSS